MQNLNTPCGTHTIYKQQYRAPEKQCNCFPIPIVFLILSYFSKLDKSYVPQVVCIIPFKATQKLLLALLETKS